MTTLPLSRARALVAPALLASLVAGLLASLPAAPLAAQRSQRTSGERTLRHDGRTRSYVLRAPSGSTPTGPALPLVIVLHGGGGNAANAEKMSGFTALVERERILIAYADGSGRRGDRLLTWNAGHCCGYAMEQKVDDVGFLGALIDAVAREFAVDPKRVYVTGMSNGAMMTHRAGRELAARIAAIAPVVGTVFGDEAQAAHAVSAIIINGKLDENVPPQGGLGSGFGRRAWDGTPARPFLDQGTYWAKVNACEGGPTLSEEGQVLHFTWKCPAGRAVELYQVKDNGHAWPGGQAGMRLGDKPSSALNATEVMWAFFKAHPKP